MKAYLKRLTGLIIILTMLLSVNVFAIEAVTNDSCSQFNITVSDNQGNYIPDANVYLYSFFDGDIVASDLTNSVGQCSLNYLPEFDISKRNTFYCDFLIYVQKGNYVSKSWSLTKFYGLEDVNDTEYLIQLEPESHISVQSKPHELSEVLQMYINTQPEKPFYVISGENLNKFADKVSRSTGDIPIFSGKPWNAEIPLGIFHVKKGITFELNFATSDKVSVETATISDSGTISIGSSGSIERKFERKTEFPALNGSTTYGEKVEYKTAGTLDYYITVDGPSARITRHIGLCDVQGGSIVNSLGVCSDCNKPYDEVFINPKYGQCVPLVAGTTYTVLKSSVWEQTLNFGSKISLSEAGFTEKLGVTIKTKASEATTYRYIVGKNYDFKLYDMKQPNMTWHVTSTTAK